MNNGDAATDGTYFYMIKVKATDGKDYTKEGPVTLVR